MINQIKEINPIKTKQLYTQLEQPVFSITNDDKYIYILQNNGELIIYDQDFNVFKSIFILKDTFYRLFDSTSYKIEIYKNKLYSITDTGLAFCYDLLNEKLVWIKPLNIQVLYFTIIDDFIYVGDVNHGMLLKIDLLGNELDQMQFDNPHEIAYIESYKHLLLISVNKPFFIFLDFKEKSYYYAIIKDGNIIRTEYEEYNFNINDLEDFNNQNTLELHYFPFLNQLFSLKFNHLYGISENLEEVLYHYCSNQLLTPFLTFDGEHTFINLINNKGLLRKFKFIENEYILDKTYQLILDEDTIIYQVLNINNNIYLIGYKEETHYSKIHENYESEFDVTIYQFSNLRGV